MDKSPIRLVRYKGIRSGALTGEERVPNWTPLFSDRVQQASRSEEWRDGG